MADLPQIPLESGTPLELLDRHQDRARLLIRSAGNNFKPLIRVSARLAIRLADRASRNWLTRQGNPYLPEIDAMARRLRLPGLHALNVCFEWGCTSGVWPSADGPVMRRVMDWPFPALGENMVVLHQTGAAGAFLSITWPGMAGIFQALAPGRFAAAINQAPMRQHGGSPFSDWLHNRILVKHSRATPPALLLRRICEQATDYAAAKDLLCTTPLAVPAIFILAGTQDGEGCVIERLEDRFVVREMGAGSVATANHFESALAQQGHGWRAREIDSAGRAACAAGLEESPGEFGWFAAPIANAYSRLACNAAPRNGTLALMGTAGAVPVTQVLRLSGC